MTRERLTASHQKALMPGRHDQVSGCGRAHFDALTAHCPEALDRSVSNHDYSSLIDTTWSVRLNSDVLQSLLCRHGRWTVQLSQAPDYAIKSQPMQCVIFAGNLNAPAAP